MGNKWYPVMILLGASLLVACSSGGDLPPTRDGSDQIADSVQQTLAAIAVARTVEAFTNSQATPVPTAAQATPVPTAAQATPVPTAAQATPPPTAAPTGNAPPPTSTLPPPTPTKPPPTPTLPPTATKSVAKPPIVENDGPGGSFPDDGSVTFNIIVDPAFLFRMDVRVLAAGDFEGAGIESVGFSISGDNVDYFREEHTAGFCVFGGGEPTCNPWPKNALGQYVWGEGGPVVESGDYFVNMSVKADEPDPDFFGEWNWNFPFRVTIP